MVRLIRIRFHLSVPVFRFHLFFKSDYHRFVDTFTLFNPITGWLLQRLRVMSPLQYAGQRHTSWCVTRKERDSTLRDDGSSEFAYIMPGCEFSPAKKRFNQTNGHWMIYTLRCLLPTVTKSLLLIMNFHFLWSKVFYVYLVITPITVPPFPSLVVFVWLHRRRWSIPWLGRQYLEPVVWHWAWPHLIQPFAKIPYHCQHPQRRHFG